MSKRNIQDDQKIVLQTFFKNFVEQLADLNGWIQKYELDGLLTENQVWFRDELNLLAQEYIDKVAIEARKKK